jgi:hypothetical protein
MFVTKKQHERDINYLSAEYERISERYWDLWRRHARLLNHLGLTEVKQFEYTEIKPVVKA